MKRIASILLVVLMMASLLLTGCGKKDAAEPAASENAAATPSAEANNTAADADDFAYITDKGTLTIGITIYDPMNYYDDNGKLVGFELADKQIDCIWNGLTITEERKENMDFSESYIKNMQVMVINKANADKFTDTASLADATVVAEVSSAGETAIAEDENLSKATYVSVPKQTDALLEVKSGTADAAVLDYTLAKSMVGEGTDYSDLMLVPDVELAVEEYAIGFRQGSSMVAKVNEAIAKVIESGKLDEIAEKYDLTESLISNQ